MKRWHIILSFLYELFIHRVAYIMTTAYWVEGDESKFASYNKESRHWDTGLINVDDSKIYNVLLLVDNTWTVCTWRLMTFYKGAHNVSYS